MDFLLISRIALILGSTLLGLCIGSFIAARVVRTTEALPQNLWGRSVCLFCGISIKIRDLVPVLSFLRLRGKCRQCSALISPVYMRIELLSAIFFAASMLVGLQTGIFPLPVDQATTVAFFTTTVLYFSTLSLLIYISCIDFLIMAFPVRMLGIFAVLHCFIGLFGIGPSIQDRLGGALLFVVVLGIIRIVGRWIRKSQVMGDGDIWLAALIGASLGISSSIVTFYGAFIIGALVALGCIIVMGRKKTTAMPLPFAPFLCIAWCIAYFFGTPLFTLLFPI